MLFTYIKVRVLLNICVLISLRFVQYAKKKIFVNADRNLWSSNRFHVCQFYNASFIWKSNCHLIFPLLHVLYPITRNTFSILMCPKHDKAMPNPIGVGAQLCTARPWLSQNLFQLTSFTSSTNSRRKSCIDLNKPGMRIRWECSLEYQKGGCSCLYIITKLCKDQWPNLASQKNESGVPERWPFIPLNYH